MKASCKGSFSDMIVAATCLLVGGFPEWVSCLATVVMAVYMAVRIVKTKQWHIQRDLLTLGVTVLVGGYGVACLWAVDRGMAFVGFCKFLPLLLYLSLLHQERKEPAVLRWIPYVAAGITAVSAVLAVIPQTASLVTVADRLAGFFQYPNTFAIFLLVSELLLFQNKPLRWYDAVTAAVLVGGVLATGSRITFVLLLLSNVVMLFCRVNKRARLAVAAVGVVLALVGGVVLFLGRDGVLGRFLTISLTESTFVGRLLYVRDALPLVWRHPFGMGYMGYFYTQMSVQTGVYTVAYIHNDFVQLLLDIGWIPALACAAAVAAFLLRRDVTVLQKLPVITLCAHALLDFDLQFIGVSLLLIAMLYRPSNTVYTLEKGGATALLAAVLLLGAASGYMAAPLLLSQSGQREAAHRLYPYHTRNTLAVLETIEDLDEAHAYAKHLLTYNTAHYVPHSIEAKYAYSQGDIGAVMKHKREAIERAPFVYTEYEEYAAMLINAALTYERKGDTASAAVAKKELLWLSAQLSKTANRLSTLGERIDDQPTTAFSADVQAYIERWRDTA